MKLFEKETDIFILSEYESWKYKILLMAKIFVMISINQVELLARARGRAKNELLTRACERVNIESLDVVYKIRVIHLSKNIVLKSLYELSLNYLILRLFHNTVLRVYSLFIIL